MLLIKTQRDTLLSPLQSVSGIVEKRHTLPILSNVLLEKKGDALTFLATDIEIQITTSAAAEGGEGDGAVTVGARKLQDILRSLPEGTEVSLVLEEKRLLVRGGKSRFTLQTLPADDFPRMAIGNDDALEITLSANQVRFAFGNVVLVSKLIDGKFPDYERVIPATLKNSLELGRTALLQSMVRAAILTNEKFRGVRLVLQGNSLKVMAANAEQEEAQEELEVEYAGDSLDVGFNVGYVLDVLNNVSSDTVTLNFNDANSSALITVPGNDRFKYVVMPMRI